jgi:hypothetical protein
VGEQREWNDKIEKRLKSFNHALRNAEKTLTTLEQLTPKTWFDELKTETGERLTFLDNQLKLILSERS